METNHGKDMPDEKKHGNIFENHAQARALLLTLCEPPNLILCQLIRFTQ